MDVLDINGLKNFVLFCIIELYEQHYIRMQYTKLFSKELSKHPYFVAILLVRLSCRKDKYLVISWETWID